MTIQQYEEFPLTLGKIELRAFLDGGFYQREGYFSEAHSHSFSELLYVAEGTVLVSVNTEQYTLRQGDILVLPKEIEHSVQTCERSSFTFLAFWDKSNFLCEIARVPSFRYGDAFLRLLDYYYRSSSFRYELISACLVEIFAHLIDALHKADSVNPVREKGRNTRLYTIEYYMWSHFKENPSLGELSHLVHLSVAQTDRTVRKLYGMSFGEKILQLRIEEAQKLLVGSELPIFRIASTLGYSATHNFYSAFKKAAGITPGEYRLKARNSHPEEA